MDKKEKLNQDIKDLPLSVDLKNCLAFKEVTTLQILLQKTPFQWHQDYPGFNYHYQQEIMNYLTRNELLEFLKEE